MQTATSPGYKDAIVGFGLVVLALLAALCLVLGPLRDLHASAERAIAGEISDTVDALRVALPLALTVLFLAVRGFLILHRELVKRGLRAPWIYWLGVSLSLPMLILVPVGPVLGVLGLMHFRRRRSEYLAPKRKPNG